jgi:hypothetical protein
MTPAASAANYTNQGETAMKKEWNRNPDPKLIKGIYNGLYARQRADKPTAAAERKNGRASRAHRLEASLPAPTRARTHDNSAAALSPAGLAELRVDAIRGLCGLYGRGLVTADNFIATVGDILKDPRGA